jgi:thymidylate synthase (FAD)
MTKQLHTASLVWATPNAEALVAKLARVSNPKNENNSATAPKLIRYLIKQQHWSPFEMVNMCVEIETTRGIAAQILRHKSLCFQEFSQRYADVAEITNTVPIPELRRQDTKNRQNSTNDLPPSVVSAAEDRIGRHFEESLDLYRNLLEQGVAKECARAVLPLATPTRMYASGTLRSWIHYISLRSANGTQEEHRQIALSVRDIFTEQFPDIAEACWGESEKNEVVSPDPRDARITELEADLATLQAIIRQRNTL